MSARSLLARFAREPDTLAVCVVDESRPVGLVERDAFLLAVAQQGAAALDGLVSDFMDVEPVLVEADTAVSALGDAVLGERSSSMMRSFVVTEDGRYIGVGSGIALLQAAARANRERADERQAAIDPAAPAQAASLAKSEAVATLQKEMQPSVNGVLAVAALLRRQPLGVDAQNYVQTIVDAGQSISRVLTDAHDLYRAEAGQLELKSRSAFVREVMDRIQAHWRPRAAEDGVTLLVSYDGDPDSAAELDWTRLEQVFNILIGDALKLARNGVVEASLRAEAVGGELRLEGRVRDSGPSARRLEAFAAEGAGKGAPLGSAMCRWIIDRMDGVITAETNVGQGATFTFNIAAPKADLARPGQSNVAELTELELQSEPHVLIVDDNATNRVVAQALCEMFGCTSECAEDGVEAVEIVQTRRFDLILMDIKMPRMDGLQATQAIRALPGPERSIPIVALTANADADDAAHYLTVGMKAVVEKPIKPERLRAAMNAALSVDEAADDQGDATAVA